jgi:type VI secretion system protein ImpF
MAQGEPELGLKPSILDRLIDPASRGTVARLGYSVEQMVDRVRRDLEDLLNTRRTLRELPPGLERVTNSVLGYGLPDLVSMSALSPKQREEIGQVLEATIAWFEPRLRFVRATLVGTDNLQHIKFRLEARLAVDPAPEVAFDTILELTTGQHQVKETTV